MKAKQFYSSMAWRYFSRRILLHYCNDQFLVQCSTCGKWGKVNDKDMHLGHLKKVFDTNGTNFATAFHELNVAPQCHQCNVYGRGKPDIMRQWLIQKHGIKNIEAMEIQSRNVCKLDKFEMDLIKKKYKSKFEKFIKLKGNPWKK